MAIAYMFTLLMMLVWLVGTGIACITTHPLKDSKMYFVIDSDVQVSATLHLRHGDIVSAFDLQCALDVCGDIRALCFATKQLAEEWQECAVSIHDETF